MLIHLFQLQDGLKKINKDEDMQEFLAKEQIKWKFIFRESPWWGRESWER